MRRNWLSVLFFALTLAVLAMAPGASRLAMAGGGFTAGEPCLSSGGDQTPDRRESPGHGDHHSDCCFPCGACGDGVAPVASRPLHIGMAPVQWRSLAWTAADRALPAARRDHSRQARAPPSHS